MRSILISLSILLSLDVSCQLPGGYSNAGNLGDILNASPTELRKMSGEAYGTIGTPNVYEEFRNGHIYFTSKSVALNNKINYDCFNDRVLLNRGELNYVLDKRKIEFLEFTEGDSSIVFRQVFLKERRTTVFMQVLYSGKITLYKHHFKTFQEADYDQAYSQDRRYDEYKDNHAWYLSSEDGELQRIRSRKKSILQVMDPYGKEVEVFMKREKPDLKSDTDLARLAAFYDSLLDN
jgi:hypothetical protein